MECDLNCRSARVIVEAFIELQCKDSTAAWPILQKVALHYDPQDVAVIIHQMPLAYHRNAFLLTEVNVFNNYRPQRSCKKVMFSQASVERFFMFDTFQNYSSLDIPEILLITRKMLI